MKTPFLILIVPLLVVGEVSYIFRLGERQTDDRMLAECYQSQGPFEQNRTLNFYFEHQLEGKYFTSYSLFGEPLGGNRNTSYNVNEKIAWVNMTLGSSPGYEVWFKVYGFDYSPGPIYP